jgi:hypothetical protein
MIGDKKYGLPMVVLTSPRGNARHGPCIKVNMTHEPPSPPVQLLDRIDLSIKLIRLLSHPLAAILDSRAAALQDTASDRALSKPGHPLKPAASSLSGSSRPPQHRAA